MPIDLIANRDDATDQLRFALNELRAMDTAVNGCAMVNQEQPSDRASVINRLQALAAYLESGGVAPDAHFAISENNSIPVQR